MDNNSKLAPDDESPNTTTDNNQPNLNQSNPTDIIFGIPGLFNSANFAQASTFSNVAENTIPSPVSTHASIFSDVSSSTNVSPISAQTSIFENVSNSNLTSLVSTQVGVFSNAPNKIISSPNSVQVGLFYNAPKSTIPPTTPTPEVDLDAIGSDSESDSDLDPDPDPDVSLKNPKEPKIPSNSSSPSPSSLSSSPEFPDFNAPGVPAKETFSIPIPLPLRSSSPPKCNTPTSLREFGIMFSSNKRNAAIKGQAQRIGLAGADKDDSGTYDPSLKRKRNTRTTRAKKKENKESDGGEGGSKTGVGTIGTTGTRSGRKTREQGSYQLIVTISLTSEEGLEYLKGIAPGPESDGRVFSPINEADDENSGADDEDIEYPIHSTRRKKIKISHNQRSDGLTLEDLSDGHPQRRGCKACFEAGDDGCSLIEHRLEWPCESCEDAGLDCELINLPELKLSCIRCKEKLRKRCSYADDAGKGVDSCKACEEANVKCIAGPKSGSGTMMRMTEVLAQIEVKRKQGLGSKGESAKKLSALATNSSTKKPQAMPRKWVPCNRCREEFKSRCSLRKDDEGPCTRCIKAKVPCTFTMLPSVLSSPSTSKDKVKGTAPVLRTPLDLTQTIILESTKLNDRVWRTTHPHARRTKAQQKAFERAQSSSKSDVQLMSSTTMTHTHQSQTIARTRTASNNHYTSTSQALPPNFTMSHNGIRTITISTAFSHPIIFNYRRDPLSLYPPCTFHSNPFFGLFGFGPRNVTVVPWPPINGAGYEELENGHGDSEVGQDKTRMCVKCTYDRVKILGCAEHVMKILEGVDERMWDEGKVRDSVRACYEGVEEGRWGGGKGGDPERGSRAELVWRAEWCAVCPSPGAWICEAGGEGDMGYGVRSVSSSTQNSNVGKGGCGLILCDTCHELHAKVQKGGKKGGRAVLGRVIQLAGDKSRRADYPDGVRADAGFLREDGELFIRRQMGGCGGSTEEGGGKDVRGVLGRGVGGFDGVYSSGLSRASSDGSGGGMGEMKGKGKGADRFAAPIPIATPSRGNNINASIKKSQGKCIEKPRPRQILDSVMISKGEVVSKPMSSIARWKGEDRGKGVDRRVNYEDEVSDDEVVMVEGVTAMTKDEVARGSEAFEGDFTGDGVSSGRWKGKGVDRRMDGVAMSVERGLDTDRDVNMGEPRVMRSVDKEWEFREIIELSD